MPSYLTRPSASKFHFIGWWWRWVRRKRWGWGWGWWRKSQKSRQWPWSPPPSEGYHGRQERTKRPNRYWWKVQFFFLYKIGNSKLRTLTLFLNICVTNVYHMCLRFEFMFPYCSVMMMMKKKSKKKGGVKRKRTGLVIQLILRLARMSKMQRMRKKPQR